MARLKLLIFALPALGLWLGQIYLTAPNVAREAERSAAARIDRAVDSARATLAERKALLYGLEGKIVDDPAVWAALPKAPRFGQAPTLTVEAFEAVRSAVLASTPKALQGALSLSISLRAAAFSAVGTATPTVATPPAEDAPPPSERIAEIGKVQYRLLTITPSASPDLVITLGLPTVPSNLAQSVAQEGTLSAVALLDHAGKVVQSAGPEANALKGALGGLSTGADSVVTRGTAAMIGPVGLPLLTSGDWLGGKAPLSEAGRRSIPGTPWELAAAVSTQAMMGAAAKTQQRALIMFGALVVLWLLCTAILRTPKHAPAMVVSEMAVTRKSPVSPAVNAPTVATQVAEPAPAAGLGLEAPPPPEEASPDDFDFGGVLGQLPPPMPPPAEPEAAPAANPFDEEKTSLYPNANPKNGLPRGLADLPPPEDEPEPEATRVAAVPSELLRASVRRGEEISIPNGAPPLPSVAPSLVDTDEVHFQEVYQDFLATRESCGEAADGLTYDKFAVKLRKNRDQLTQKYACRTVRFQVYVKEGKAALKATPVKD